MITRWNEFWSSHPRLLSDLQFWAGAALVGGLVLGAFLTGIELARGLS